ncbi:hypothetical protein C8J57DRAFT_1228540 [Mycena rebaudengoi]|nr:hypothetical protein C8J57DRAFT_1228540 [Mycena rebaudengoi]
MSNWDHIVLLLSWSYSLASRWVTTSTILLIYGLVLIYLLLVVHVLAIPQENPGRRKLQGWVREERENTKSHERLVSRDVNSKRACVWLAMNIARRGRPEQSLKLGQKPRLDKF